jgi:transcriptional regulator with XRE-family HTH domain
VNDENGPSDYAKRVGQRLRSIRKERRLSLPDVEVASIQEFRASVLGAYERGDRALSVPRLQRLARFYGLPVEELLPRDEPPAPTDTGEADQPAGQLTVADLLRAAESAPPPSAMATSPDLRFGAGFTDGVSGLRIEVHHPSERPDLWREYLDGAEVRYRAHGIEHALDRPTIEDGRSTSLFFVAVDEGRVVAGIRCHGPLVAADDAFVLRELEAHPQWSLIHELLDARISLGLVEIKGAWVAKDAPRTAGLSNTLARCHVHAMNWFGTRFAFCSCADTVAPRWESTGGRRMDELALIAYPDERYHTVLLWWDRDTILSLAEPEQSARIALESEELAGGPPAAIPLRAGDTVVPLQPVALAGTAAVATSECRAVVFDDRIAEHRAAIGQLRADPTIDVLDRAVDQIDEVRRLRPRVGPEILAEPTRWVYYPWRRSLVRIIGPTAFRTLRLDRNRNKLTRPEQAKLAALRVGMVGLSVGHTVAFVLALEGLCGELRVADFDTIELSNLNRIPGSVFDLGINKATVIARRVAEIDPYLTVVAHPEGVNADNVDTFVAGLDVVIEECDSLDLKLLVREVARRRKVPVIMETSDRGLLDVERFDLEPDRPLFHGLLGDVQASDLTGLTTHDKVPYVLRILEPNELSPRMAASMAEVDETVTTWPQLGADVTLGAATVATAVQRLGLGEPLPSGRVRVDLDDILDQLAPPRPARLDFGNVAVPPPPEPPANPFTAVAHAASLAPSGGNAQPWTLRLDEQGLQIYLNRDRTSTMDVAFRGSCVAIGAALFNARVAAAAHGVLGPARILPRGEDSDLVASLQFGDEVDLGLAERYPLVLDRCTNRRPGEPEPISGDLIAALRDEADREGARLHVLAARDAIQECAELLAESDRLRYLTPVLHSDMMRELSWPGQDPLEVGIDVRTLELDATDVAKLAVARRSDVMEQLAAWDAGHALGEVTRDRVRTSSALVAVTISGTDKRAYVQGGAAVERVWLAATSAGLAVQPSSPVFIFAVEDQDYRRLVGEPYVERLRNLASSFRAVANIPVDESLVLLLRASYAPPPSVRSARLPLDALMQHQTPVDSSR